MYGYISRWNKLAQGVLDEIMRRQSAGRKRTRKRIHTAVVIRSFSYTKRMGSPNASFMKYAEYGIEVKYAKGTREFKSYDADAGKYLENPIP